MRKVICAVIIAVAMLYVLAAAGGLERELTSFGACLIRCGAGLAVMAGAAAGMRGGAGREERV